MPVQILGFCSMMAKERKRGMEWELGSWCLQMQNLWGPQWQELDRICRGCAGSWFPQWQKLLRSSVEQSAGVSDKVPSDESCRGPRHLQGLLGSSVTKAARVLCRPGPGNNIHSHRMANTGSPWPFSLSLAISRCLSYAGFWVG